MKSVMLAAVLVLVAGAMRVMAEPVDCNSSRCAAASAIAAECPSCAEATNHGAYVSCVARTIRTTAGVETNCRGKVTRCAAKSICGKPGFVTCHIPTSTCDLTTHVCANSTLACLTDLDCGFKCKIKSSADGCTTRGGTVSTDTSCCAAAVCGG